MYIDREALEDRLEILDHLLATHDERVKEHTELSLVRSLLHAQDEGLIDIDDDGGCRHLACPSDLSASL